MNINSKDVKKIPSYLKIYKSIKKDILKDNLLTGDKLPSESELEKIFSVSKTPVRQALNQLENDGYIYRQQGKGSFVANYFSQEKWINMTGFKMEYIQDWDKVTAETLSVDYVQSSIISQALNINENTNLIFLTRVRYLNNKPIFYMEHYISPIISIDTFKKNKYFSSIQQVLSVEENIELITVDEYIEAINSDDKVSKHLDIPHSTALLKGNRISFDSTGMPINIDVFYTNTDKWKYFSSYKY